jgi:hypothetical protein
MNWNSVTSGSTLLHFTSLYFTSSLASLYVIIAELFRTLVPDFKSFTIQVKQSV